MQYDIHSHSQLSSGYPFNSEINPSGVTVAFSWSLTPDTISFPNISDGWYRLDDPTNDTDFMLHMFYIAECNVTVYNLSIVYSTLSSDNPFSYAAEPIISNFNTTSALLAGVDPAYPPSLVDKLQENLQPDLQLPRDVFLDILAQNISVALLAAASPLMERQLAAKGSQIVVQAASRYPLAPLSLVLTILYGYAFAALILAFVSLFLSSPTISAVKGMTILELAQSRLTNPLANVADHFSQNGESIQPLTTSAIDLFPAESSTSKRLKFGLVGEKDKPQFKVDVEQ
ncbi:hypothetical protein VKT23_013898 [Stygiomarasmius scandens]|uniref:Uncharacterized protein n=1 Tax=Marasmiellus scandens TaxID=2682957 RepID=A0ABR1J768_9AGAR